MNAKSLIFLCLILAVLLGGCGGNISKTMATWIGHPSSELIASWGPPTRVMGDGKDGQLFIYESGRSFSSPGYATTQTSGTISRPLYQTTYSPPVTSGYTASRTFWVNGEGTIYSWSWKGL